jgi:flagellar biosynthesis anti-sigma factor FlgM
MSHVERIKINNPGLDPSYGIQGQEQARAGQSGQTSTAKDDSVALSVTAKEIDRFSGLVAQSREERIEQVRQMVADGTYRVSSEDVARQLIQSNWK